MAKKKKSKHAKPAVTIRVGNPGSYVTIRVPGRSKKQALARARQFVKRHTKNILVISRANLSRSKKEAYRKLQRAAHQQESLFHGSGSRKECRPHMKAARILRKAARDLKYGTKRRHPWVSEAMEA